MIQEETQWLSDPGDLRPQSSLAPLGGTWGLCLLPAPVYLAHPSREWVQGLCPIGADGKALGAVAVTQSGPVSHHPHAGTVLGGTLL